jgi:hypothetical protein
MAARRKQRSSGEGQNMVLRISKTGAIYCDAPFTQAELEERQHPASVAVPAKAIALKRLEAGRHAFIAVAGDMQVGWCIRREGGWHIEDMDCNRLAGPFKTLAAVTSAGQQVLAHEAGASNPD